MLRQSERHSWAAKATLIEKNKLGGTCLNVGCIPTKAILHAAEALTEAKEMAEYGIHIEVKNVDWKQVQAKKKCHYRTAGRRCDRSDEGK